MPRREWINVVSGSEIKTGVNSQIRTAMVESVGNKIMSILVIRKWAKYCTVADKMAGFNKDDVPFRPTKDGVSFSASFIPQVIADLQKIYDCAIENGMAKYDPSLSAVENNVRTTQPYYLMEFNEKLKEEK